ncbi:hypothetical protein [Fulvivirga imtechensis]|uniref:hypothetical protein n=1 Tax=Fulvivirga imtechensis TaxID=881893 RepID=UPI0012F7B89D|nr:hypothetical protein [Fulvivirga imtechensis]
MNRFNKSIDKRDHTFDIEVNLNDPKCEDGLYTAFVTITRKRASMQIEVAGLNVRDENGNRRLFDTVEEAFEEAEAFMTGFNIYKNLDGVPC